MFFLMRESKRVYDKACMSVKRGLRRVHKKGNNRETPEKKKKSTFFFFFVYSTGG